MFISPPAIESTISRVWFNVFITVQGWSELNRKEKRTLEPARSASMKPVAAQINSQTVELSLASNRARLGDGKMLLPPPFPPQTLPKSVPMAAWSNLVLRAGASRRVFGSGVWQVKQHSCLSRPLSGEGHIDQIANHGAAELPAAIWSVYNYYTNLRDGFGETVARRDETAPDSADVSCLLKTMLSRFPPGEWQATSNCHHRTSPLPVSELYGKNGQ